jgi:hypothetical protein
MTDDDPQTRPGVAAYHGSPHDFDQFSMDRIGTGEGVQAYGHGLYFAETEGVARQYRDDLSKDYYATDQGLFRPDDLQHMNVRVAARTDLDAAADRARDLLARQPENAPLLNSDLERLEAARSANPRQHAGHMYEVHIDAHPDHFLDWDAPILEQPHAYEKMLDALYARADGPPEFGADRQRVPWQALIDEVEEYGHDLTGEDLHDRLTHRSVIGLPAKDAAAFLRDAGIPGIKYLDHGSRGQGEGTRNYVVFDEKLIKPRRKYALGGVGEDEERPGITAWHGSGADFDQFDMSKVGSGMQAQAYGHGLYFSENPDTAREYRDTLVKDVPQSQWRVGDTPVGDFYQQAMQRADAAPGEAMAGEYDKLGLMEDLLNVGDVHGVRQTAPDRYRPETVDWFEQQVAPSFSRPGKLYEVHIDAHPEHFLDWDKPIMQQPHLMRAIEEHLGDPEIALQRMVDDPQKAQGSHFFYAISGGAPSSPQASQKLASMGVHGVTYQDDRWGTSDPVRNYVVFDDKRVKIRNKYKGGGAVDAPSSDIPQIDNAVSVFPKPQRMFPADAPVPGGQYLNAATKEDMTGHKAAMASIGVAPGGKPYFRASPDALDETGTPGRGSAIAKANLFKQKAGWRWLSAPEGHEDTATIVSVEHRGRHHYALNAHFPKGVDFARYENAPSEPRLRPTTRGAVALGPQVGTISVRGKEHPVHEHVIVKQRGGAVEQDETPADVGHKIHSPGLTATPARATFKKKSGGAAGEAQKRSPSPVVERALMVISGHRRRP